MEARRYKCVCTAKHSISNSFILNSIFQFPGCDKSVKSQGHCQRHGAKAKRCKIHGCGNQAQGSHKGHCKRHYRELFSSPSTQKYSPRKKTQEIESLRTCDPIGVSVYDSIIPSSFAWKMEGDDINKSPKKGLKLDGDTINLDESSAIETEFIPILQHLVDNEALDFGWHRTAERLSQGTFLLIICRFASQYKHIHTYLYLPYLYTCLNSVICMDKRSMP